MRNYDREFKEEEVKLSNKVGLKQAAELRNDPPRLLHVRNWVTGKPTLSLLSGTARSGRVFPR